MSASDATVEAIAGATGAALATFAIFPINTVSPPPPNSPNCKRPHHFFLRFTSPKRCRVVHFGSLRWANRMDWICGFGEMLMMRHTLMQLSPCSVCVYFWIGRFQPPKLWEVMGMMKDLNASSFVKLCRRCALSDAPEPVSIYRQTFLYVIWALIGSGNTISW